MGHKTHPIGFRLGVIKTWSSKTTNKPGIVNVTISRHTPNHLITNFVTENMVGHKLGEFAPTRTFFGHAGDKKSKGKR